MTIVTLALDLSKNSGYNRYSSIVIYRGNSIEILNQSLIIITIVITRHGILIIIKATKEY
jgi:hypothetical protein